jgi:hypothetical protein
MTEGVLEKCVAMVCAVVLLIGGYKAGLDASLINMGLILIASLTGVGTGQGNVSFGRKTPGGKKTDEN